MIDPDWIVRRMLIATAATVIALLVVGAAVAFVLLEARR